MFYYDKNLRKKYTTKGTKSIMTVKAYYGF